MKTIVEPRAIMLIVSVCVFFLIWRFIAYENKALLNVGNCQMVKEGMTHTEVLLLMGEPENQVANNGKINYEDVEILKWHFNTPDGASSGVNIYFDKHTNRVMKVVCDE